MVSINIAPNYSLLPPRPIWVLKFPAICLPPELFLEPGAARRRRKKPPSAVCANLGCCSSGTWVSKRMHYDYLGSRSIVCKVWENEGDLDLESEILDFMKESEKPEAFPTMEELVAAGRTDLVQAIKKKGGWLSLGWNSDDEDEVQSSQRIDIVDMEVPKSDQEDRRHSEIGEVSSDSATTSHWASSIEMEDTQETGIEGILGGLEKERNLSYGKNLEEDLSSARASHSHTENAKDANSDYLGRSNTVTLGSQNKISFNNSGTDFSQRRSLSDIDGSESSKKPAHWRDWIYQRAGFSIEDFEPGIITYRSRHEKDNQINDLDALTESSGEVLDKQKDISDEEIRSRLEHLELQLSSALRLLRSKSAKYVAGGVRETPDELPNLTDALEFQETDIMHAQGKLRSLRAKLAVLGGKKALALIAARKAVEEKQRKVKSARRAVELLRDYCIVWSHPAMEVLLAGTFDGWTTQRKMEKLSTGKFSLSLKLYPGRYEIKFIVDGKWRADPLRSVVNNRGCHNNLIIVT